MSNRSGVIALLAITDSVALFVVACVLPALDLRPIPATGVPTPASLLIAHSWTGLDLLLRGWAGIPAAEFAWLASPLLLCTWLALGLRRWRTAFLLALVALASTASGLGRDTITLQGDTGPMTLVIDGVLLGYYLWLASAGLAALGALVGWIAGRTVDRVAEHAGRPHFA